MSTKTRILKRELPYKTWNHYVVAITFGMLISPLMKITYYFICFLLFPLMASAQVGIGTTSPQAQLDVDGGTVRFSAYGTGSIRGSQTYLLGVEADGDIVEVTNLQGTQGAQYYAWDTASVSQPNIDNPRTLRVPTTAGRYAGPLNDAARAAADPSSNDEGYILRFVATLSVQNTGSFTFNSDSDDGSRIYIDNMLILEDWIDQGPGSIASASVNLSAGNHSIEFWYYENSGGDFMNFTWGTNPDGYTVNSSINTNDLLVQ